MSLFFYSPLLKDAPKEETIEEVYEMVLSKPFKIDTWCRIYKPSATKTLHDSCVAPLSLSDLSKLSDNAECRGALDLDLPLSYGHVLGSPALRKTIANLYKTENSTPVTWNDVIITTGTISANFLILDTLLAPGDHVICQYPTYQQLYEVPKRAGAEVALWKMREENSWVPDVKELAGLVKTNTKMIILNNPANPTGAVISASILNGIIEFAKSRNIIILCDEVFSPLFFDEVPPSILSMSYSNVISTRSLSKGFSLPGIRVGWIASPNKGIMTQVADSRDYTTIAVSQLDDQVANFALSDAIRPRILERSIDFCKANIAVLEKFVEEHQEFCSWIKPNGSATAFIKISKNGIPVDDAEFCRDVLKKVKLLLIPGGHAFGTEGVSDFKGYIRIGFVYKPDQFIENIGALTEYLRSYF